MRPFDVYPTLDITPISGSGCYLYDNNNIKYLDFYGGHAVISVGHCHPHYIKRLGEQLQMLGFYSNAVQNPLQQALALKLGKMSDYDDYHLFLCNSGAEANENAIKLASFFTKKKRVLAFRKSFHGRTSGTVVITDNVSIQSPFNKTDNVVFVELGDIAAVEKHLASNEFCAVIVEPIQGVAGIIPAGDEFLRSLHQICMERNVVFIADEVQSGYGRTGKFFAHQWSLVRPDIITAAKGMGSGFPIGACLIAPKISAVHNQLGTTFGGNHLACTAALAVLEIMETEDLIKNAYEVGKYLMEQLKMLPHIKDLRGRGLMIGIEMEKPVSELRKQLLYEKHIFTGVAGNNVIRLLPPLCIKKQQADEFLQAFTSLL
jgi:acetylornithine aminotransferase